MKKLICITILLCVAIAGCVTETQYVTVDGKPAPIPTQSYLTMRELLPPDSKNLTEIGNGWFTFEREDHKYICTWSVSYAGYRHVILEQISPLTKPCTCATMCEQKGITLEQKPIGLVE